MQSSIQFAALLSVRADSSLAGPHSYCYPPKSQACFSSQSLQPVTPQPGRYTGLSCSHCTTSHFFLLNFLECLLARSLGFSWCLWLKVCQSHTSSSVSLENLLRVHSVSPLRLMKKMLNKIGHSIKSWGSPLATGSQPGTEPWVTILQAQQSRQFSTHLIFHSYSPYFLCFQMKISCLLKSWCIIPGFLSLSVQPVILLQKVITLVMQRCPHPISNPHTYPSSFDLFVCSYHDTMSAACSAFFSYLPSQNPQT